MYTYNTVIIKGAGDLATGVAHKLYRSGFPVIMTEVNEPNCVRRNVSFANCIYEDTWEVEGIRAKRATNLENIMDIMDKNMIPVLIDKECNIMKQIKPLVLVDAILAKRNTNTSKDNAPIVIGLGPGLEAGKDVDIVIETNRGHNLGRLIFEGYTSPDTGIPGELEGYTVERVLRATSTGTIHTIKEIGSIVSKDEVIALIDQEEIKASINGIIRGLIYNGTKVNKGMKIGDIDPRMDINSLYTISEKARCIAGGVLEAIFMKKFEFKNKF